MLRCWHPLTGLSVSGGKGEKQAYTFLLSKSRTSELLYLLLVQRVSVMITQ